MAAPDVPDYDVLVVGSGFGGSVTALRLTGRATACWAASACSTGCAASSTPTTACTGAPYRRVAPVAPHHPAVPADAPGVLRTTTDLPTPTLGAPT